MRQIYIVDAHIVDANGTFNHVQGYPKPFDSRSYNGDVNKTLQRAMGDYSEAFGAMCKIDTRKLQTVTLMTADGFLIQSQHIGSLDGEETETE